MIKGTIALDAIDDPHFLEIIKGLRGFKYMPLIDVRDDNVMVRRYKYGYQLVFSDPIA